MGILNPDDAKYIKWYDYLWLLVPIAGIALMDAVVTDRKRSVETTQEGGDEGHTPQDNL